MGKKRKTQVFVSNKSRLRADPQVIKPWCWYCEREFEDDKVLLQHQKSKHFKCQLCPRKLNTAGGLMVHSQQVHKCEPEPLTNTLPGRDGYDIEIFGMEGVPTNALAEWKARKEAEAGTAALAAASAAQRPRHSYAVVPEADLMAALAQHKVLMAQRGLPRPLPFPTLPPFMPGMPPPTLPPGAMPGYGMPPPTFMQPPPISYPPAGSLPPFPPPGQAAVSPLPPPSNNRQSSDQPSPLPAVAIQPPKDGVMWPDNEASPAERRALQPKYRYVSPSPDGRKRKAAADYI